MDIDAPIPHEGDFIDFISNKTNDLLPFKKFKIATPYPTPRIYFTRREIIIHSKYPNTRYNDFLIRSSNGCIFPDYV